MSKKISKPFELTYTLTHKVVRNLKIKTEVAAIMKVEGYLYFDPSQPATEIFDRYSVDIDAVKYMGTNIKPVLDTLPIMDDIEVYCIRNAGYFFTQKEVA